MKKTNHFTIQELVHPQILKAIGEYNAWLRLDPDCLDDLDTLREEWGKYCEKNFPGELQGIYINSGKSDSRGLRPPNDPDGGFYSTHKQGNTFDGVPANGRYREFFDFVKHLIETDVLTAFNTLEYFEYTPTWTHMAKMNHNHKPLMIKP